MSLLSYVFMLTMLPEQPGLHYLVPDSDTALVILLTYQEGGHSRDGLYYLDATVVGCRCLSQASTIYAVTTSSHWIPDRNVRVDAATKEPQKMDLT